MSWTSPTIPEIMDVLRLNRHVSVVDEGYGMVVTHSRLKYLKMYVSGTGEVHTQYEYPLHSRNSRICELAKRSLHGDGVVGKESFALHGDLRHRYGMIMAYFALVMWRGGIPLHPRSPRRKR